MRPVTGFSPTPDHRTLVALVADRTRVIDVEVRKRGSADGTLDVVIVGLFTHFSDIASVILWPIASIVFLIGSSARSAYQYVVLGLR